MNPLENIILFLSQLIQDHVLTPFWKMWTQMNVTFEGILATIIIVFSIYVVLECYRWIRKPKKKLKITKIKFS